MQAQDHVGVRRLDFLPYHFLLTSVGEGGILRYQVLSPYPARNLTHILPYAIQSLISLLLRALAGTECSRHPASCLLLREPTSMWEAQALYGQLRLRLILICGQTRVHGSRKAAYPFICLLQCHSMHNARA